MKKSGGSRDEAGTSGAAADPARPETASQAPSHLGVLKALADPLRLNLLYALSRRSGPDLPAKTVKELAAELSEPQTKLYRHIKLLESTGLIRSASSRVVSGIVEHRYQVSSSDMVLGDDLTAEEKLSPEAEALAAAALELYRRQYFTTRRSLPADQSGIEPHRRSFLAIADGRIPAARAAAIYEQLYQLLEEVYQTGNAPAADDTDEDLVPVNVLIGFYTDEQPPA